MKISFVSKNSAPFSLKRREQVLYCEKTGAKIPLEFPIFQFSCTYVNAV
jgi:hypothetical protein